MGVPAFFRWLSRKYPTVIIECIEDKQYNTDDGKQIPLDSSKPNPNGVEFDNLYLDMNGIIHPCTHPEDRPPPKDEDEMMAAIFECIDRLFAIVRPRKLLYMAIDGVAPRAKMNQQRSRRFRASKEAIEKKVEIARIRQELKDKGFNLPPEKPKESHFDSNCITPGTPFMDRLSKCLHYYIHDRLNTDPGWRGIKVILSDANVPGEGEHKIMDYIRRQRAQPDHDPNTHHCLCGADADLIMLGLATHEVNFTIIREEFKPNKPKPCDICGQLGHEVKECVGVAEGSSGEADKVFEETRFIFVRLNVLREYLEKELAMPGIPFKYDFDRAIDDWVMMCFFVGNDFLPHLPSLEIRENAIDRLVRLYKDCCYKTGGWLTDSGIANMERVQMILQNLGKVEDEIFRTRQKRELEFRARDKMKKRSEKMEKEAANRFKNQTGQGALGVMRAGETSVAHGAKNAIMDQRYSNMNDGGGRGKKRSIDSVDSDEEEEIPDEVRLYEDGAKDRYYESKFEVCADNLEFRKRVADEYARGLCWVLKYYYQGCASWDWYFPFHYAPFASDFTNCAKANVEFDIGEPFNPLEQLMGVFPAASRDHVPEPWGELMIDPDSVIIDFYPEDFKIDLNGKKFAWQGVALLPFVDEKRLKKALDTVYDLLTEEEKRRNKRGDSRMYISVKHEAYSQLTDMYRIGMNVETEVPISGKEYQGMQGTVLQAHDSVDANSTLLAPVRGMEPVENNQVVTVRFRDPKYPDGFIFPSRRLEKADSPPRVLKPQDLSAIESKNYRPQIGFAKNMPRASLNISGHRTLGHLLPNLHGGGLYSNNVPLLQGARGGQGLLGASPGLLPTPPRPGSFLGPSLGGPGPFLGPPGLGGPGSLLGPGQEGLLGSGPGMQGNLLGSRFGVQGNGAGSMLGQGKPVKNGKGRGGGLLGLGPQHQGPFLGNGSQQGWSYNSGIQGNQQGSLLGSGPQQDGALGRGNQMGGLLGSEPQREDMYGRGGLLGPEPQREDTYGRGGLLGPEPQREDMYGRGSLLGSEPQREDMYGRGGLLGPEPHCEDMYGRGGQLGSEPQREDMYGRGGLLGSEPQREDMYGRGSLLGPEPPREDMYGRGGQLEGAPQHENRFGGGNQKGSLLGSSPQQEDIYGRGSKQGEGLLGPGPNQVNPYKMNFEEGSLLGAPPDEDYFDESNMDQAGLLGMSPPMSHHMNRGRGGGQYSNVPPPQGSRGGGYNNRGGNRSLLGVPPSTNFQMMSQSSNYHSSQGNSYSGGGGYGGGRQSQSYNNGSGYNSNRNQGGYSSSQRHSTAGFGYSSGNNRYNSGGGNSYSSGGGGGGGAGGNGNTGGSYGGYNRNTNWNYSSQQGGRGRGGSGGGGGGGYYTSNK
ncbi:5'-3' exoribonuclease 2 homolog isoform X1 [Procambarus clarkii]|uniref:5'-3' exoribonuclease 2 homolog isoform X1 n=1 Tax=Procambarus clarkii TaxID=6728 RepID=UPI003743582E